MKPEQQSRQSERCAMSKKKEHWLPRVYLRPFKAHLDKETVFVFDLLEKPCWREVGFFEIGYSRGYHFSPKADAAIDSVLLKEYSSIIAKISQAQESVDLGALLEKEEIDHLLRFIQAHRIRNPLISYNFAYSLFYEYLVEDPEKSIDPGDSSPAHQ